MLRVGGGGGGGYIFIAQWISYATQAVPPNQTHAGSIQLMQNNGWNESLHGIRWVAVAGSNPDILPNIKYSVHRNLNLKEQSNEIFDFLGYLTKTEIPRSKI